MYHYHVLRDLCVARIALPLLSLGFDAYSSTCEQGLLVANEAMGVLLCRDYGLGFCANSLALGCDCLVRSHLTSYSFSAIAKLAALSWCLAHMTSRLAFHAFGISPAPAFSSTEGAPPVQGHIKYTDAVLNNSKGALSTSCRLKPLFKLLPPWRP